MGVALQYDQLVLTKFLYFIFEVLICCRFIYFKETLLKKVAYEITQYQKTDFITEYVSL